MRAANPTDDASRVANPHSTGIKVIVVGLGIGGIAAAVECHRKGHTVVAFEKAPAILPLGDNIGIASNAARVLRKWGDGVIGEKLHSCSTVHDRVSVCDSGGSVLFGFEPDGYKEGDGYMISRGDLAKVMYGHAQALGIDMRFGKKVEEYWEDGEHAGIVLDGEKIEAGCVICCDGVKSKARQAIAGRPDSLPAWDRAITRAWLGSEGIAADPKASWILEGGTKETMISFTDKDTYFVMTTAKKDKLISWYCIHKIPESRGPEALFSRITVDEVLDYLADWGGKEKIEAVIRKTPASNVADYGLFSCDPFEKWISSGGRTIIIGDAAHPFMPTTGQGGSQAIEDAATLAITLELAGKHDVRLALRTAEKIRRPRVTAIRRNDVKHNEAKRQMDWNDVSQNLSLLAPPQSDWVYNHDCQVHAYEEYASVASAV